MSIGPLMDSLVHRAKKKLDRALMDAEKPQNRTGTRAAYADRDVQHRAIQLEEITSARDKVYRLEALVAQFANAQTSAGRTACGPKQEGGDNRLQPAQGMPRGGGRPQAGDFSSLGNGRSFIGAEE